jgi:hypothetical protein
MRFPGVVAFAVIACWSSGTQARETDCKPDFFPFIEVAAYPPSPLNHLGSPPPEADELVDQLDDDQDGYQSPQSFTTWYKTATGLLVYFHGSDSGGNWTGFSKTPHGWEKISTNLDCPEPL